MIYNSSKNTFYELFTSNKIFTILIVIFINFSYNFHGVPLSFRVCLLCAMMRGRPLGEAGASLAKAADGLRDVNPVDELLVRQEEPEHLRDI